MITRRCVLQGTAISLLTAALATRSHAQPISSTRIRIAATWRGPKVDDAYEAGVIAIDSEARTIAIEWSAQLPGRAHGMHVFADGSFVVVAVRPGRWLMRFDSNGKAIAAFSAPSDEPRYLNGHATSSADGQFLFTAETDPRDDSGFIGVRDARTLQTVAAWSTQGIEPHHIMLHGGHLIVCNGGIRRTLNDKKRELDRMESSLVQLHVKSGSCVGQWRLNDRRLSLRHLAIASTDNGQPPLVGIGMQSEHDTPEQREQAPLLAVWNGRELRIATYAADAAGYAGDISPATGGGFVVSNPRQHKAWWWHPAAPARLTNIAQLSEVNALERVSVLGSFACALAAAKGVAIWHPTQPAMLLPWPKTMVIDNHWATIES